MISIDEINRLQAENAELKAENERLKTEMTELEEKFLTLNGKSYSYYTTLQEIKTIAEENKDTVQYGGICRSILMELTKAEEE